MAKLSKRQKFLRESSSSSGKSWQFNKEQLDRIESLYGANVRSIYEPEKTSPQQLSSKRKNFLSMTGKLDDFMTQNNIGPTSISELEYTSCTNQDQEGLDISNDKSSKGTMVPLWSMCREYSPANGWVPVPNPNWQNIPSANGQWLHHFAWKHCPLNVGNIGAQWFTAFHAWLQSNHGPINIGDSVEISFKGGTICSHTGNNNATKICLTHKGYFDYGTTPYNGIIYTGPLVGSDAVVECCNYTGSGPILETWDCVIKDYNYDVNPPTPNYTCVQRYDGSGQYFTKQNCLNSGCETNYPTLFTLPTEELPPIQLDNTFTTPIQLEQPEQQERIIPSEEPEETPPPRESGDTGY